MSEQGLEDFWVFAYGSLMWKPGFDFVESCHARLYGYHRAFCVYSHVHRGTPERPGLVFGLDRGGSCRGIAYRLASGTEEEVVDYLRAREQVTMIYKEAYLPLHLLNDEATKTKALCFIVDRDHHQYAAKVDFDRQAQMIAEGVGSSGENPEYLYNTVDHLRELGIQDHGLEKLSREVSIRVAKV